MISPVYAMASSGDQILLCTAYGYQYVDASELGVDEEEGQLPNHCQMCSVMQQNYIPPQLSYTDMDYHSLEASYFYFNDSPIPTENQWIESRVPARAPPAVTSL
jgi:hypothetical protein